LPCYAVPVGDGLTWPELSQLGPPSHNWQRHYPHSARHHRANLARGFLPWGFSDACRPSTWHPPSSGRRPRTL